MPTSLEPSTRAVIGARLRKARGDRTQAAISHAAGITQASLSNYELGKREVPTSTLVALAAVLGKKATHFMPELAR